MATTKVIIVGDMHVVPEELDDCGEVIKLIQSVARTEEVGEVWFVGDQHHNHELVHLAVMHWWKNALHSLSEVGIRTMLMVGNHDQLAPGSNIHSMMTYERLDKVKVVDTPTIRQGVLMVPYFHDKIAFLDAVNSQTDERRGAPKTIVCHQTFDGSKYENGFYASDGIDPKLLPQELIISGHIHTPQEFGSVWYVGAPRWRGANDANTNRAIWVVTFEDGELRSRIPYTTGDVCRQILHLEDTESSPVDMNFNHQHKYTVDVKGSPAWCERRKLELAAAGARVRTFPSREFTREVKESDGVDVAFKGYLGAYHPKHGTDLGVLGTMAKQRSLM